MIRITTAGPMKLTQMSPLNDGNEIRQTRYYGEAIAAYRGSDME